MNFTEERNDVVQKALHWLAIPLRSIVASELLRYPTLGMARNVEIKARVSDLHRLRIKMESLAPTPPETLVQTDAFFVVPRGRLKPREFSDGSGELIFYDVMPIWSDDGEEGIRIRREVLVDQGFSRLFEDADEARIGYGDRSHSSIDAACCRIAWGLLLSVRLDSAVRLLGMTVSVGS